MLFYVYVLGKNFNLMSASAQTRTCVTTVIYKDKLVCLNVNVIDVSRECFNFLTIPIISNEWSHD